MAGWWRFEGNVTDLLGLHNGNILGVLNTAAYVSGEVGRTLSFDGSHAVGLFPTNGAPNPGQGGGFTVEGWINPSDLTTAPVASWFGFNPNSNVKFMLECKPLNPAPGYLYAWFYDTNGTAHIVNGAANRTVVTNQFQHVALTYDNASGVAKIYWNGTMVGSNMVGASFFPSQQYYALFGSDNASTYFHGLIDELSFYTRALSQAEIQGIYAASFAGKCVPDITSQPQSLSVAAGSNATFSVSAIAGSGPADVSVAFQRHPDHQCHAGDVFHCARNSHQRGPVCRRGQRCLQHRPEHVRDADRDTADGAPGGELLPQPGREIGRHGDGRGARMSRARSGTAR